MLPVLVELHAASAEGSSRKKEEKEESVVKPKFADNYVGRPNERVSSFYL